MPDLVIVESPTKAKTISKFLGKDFVIKSSYGHIRDLPKKEMGIDVNNNFEPTYVVEDAEKKKVVDSLKKDAKKSTLIYFATDEDREGEAIAWHLVELLKPKKEQIKRITFHEITKHAIEDSLKHPRDIDMNRVSAQQARRILDRLVGYELSPFLWKKVARGLSAGRVQSVAVRLIVERETQILQFKQEEYWTLDVIFNKEEAQATGALDEKNLPEGFFSAKLSAINGKTIDKFEIKDTTHAHELEADLKNATYTITRVEKKETKKNPTPPFTTSTLQQEANRKLGFSAKQAMRIAQQLYEEGHITYMRTDSVNLSTKFLGEAKDYLIKEFGEKYALKSPRSFKTKSKTAQEAHEAIRPTEAMHTPASLAASLEPRSLKLYDLIWRRAIGSQMPEAIMDNTSIDVTTKTDAEYVFRATGQTIQFDGFLKIYPATQREDILPELAEKEVVHCASLNPNQHFTEPPARYSDASLVKALEEYEIGRPSTYAPTISTIIDRGYVERIENRRLKPTDIAFLVTDILVEHFPIISDYKFTAGMENQLDKIAEGKLDWEKAIREFYEPFKKNLMEKTESLSKKDLTEEKTDEKCDTCGKPMIIKTGRFGRFLACTGYPECKTTKPINGNGEAAAAETTDEKCPECGGAMQVKHGKFGTFLGCSKYPDCKGIKKIEKGTGVACPECGKGEIVEKRSKAGRTFYACNQYPDCKTAFFAKPINEKCPDCESQMVFGPKGTYKCSSKECKFSKPAEQQENELA
ncbi:DNA topoisomerase I [bacterium CG10_46_32]|nr:MAG: DNA topoisomerase I [bacterium CG10_46_32]PIR56465.1 MAG: type I DNA topoisomerase [Parcubacteria group bacterium CG10_big_fil_rev_8_21_14_0_10_46_32]